ncbi:hypothetical protein MRX96_030682 [Rhipicephalus microplus]
MCTPQKGGGKTDTKQYAKNVPTPTDLFRDSSKPVGVQMRSAQAPSFWSMYSSVAARVRPMQYFPVADLACAVATILATAVVIVSLVGVLTIRPVTREQKRSNRDPLYDGRYLSGLGDVVVVVPNYRLGALGFLYMGISVAPGNVGLYNQLLVIEWTRHNIGRFGGNVSNLVLVSYGSGATATGYLLGSQVAGVREAGVVPRRAILMSGSPLTRYPDNTNSAARRMAEQAKRMRCLIDGQPDIKYFIESSASLFVKTAMPPLFFPTFKALIKIPPEEMLHKDDASIHSVPQKYCIDTRDS